VTVHCELKVLNLDEGETKKLTHGRTSMPYKTTASPNIPAEFQEILPVFQLYIIQKRKKIAVSSVI